MNQIVQMFSKFNLVAESNSHSWEAAILSTIIVLISLFLFAFWHKKNALINFKAWTLLLFVINLIEAIHYSPLGPHFTFNNVEYQFSFLTINFLNFLEYLASAVTIYRLWQLSEKYIPRLVLNKLVESERGVVIRGKSQRCQIKARILALFHTFKNGGNDGKNMAKIRKNIANNL